MTKGHTLILRFLIACVILAIFLQLNLIGRHKYEMAISLPGPYEEQYTHGWPLVFLWRWEVTSVNRTGEKYELRESSVPIEFLRGDLRAVRDFSILALLIDIAIPCLLIASISYFMRSRTRGVT